MKYWIVFMTLLAAGCSSTPQSHYYLLSSKATSASAPCDCSIGIGPVTVAEYLNRPQITTRGEPGRLQVEQFHRWGEPLRHNIERALLENLATLTGSSQVVVHPWRQNQRPEHRVAINILSMDRSASRATIKVQWQIANRPAKISSFSSELADSGYNSLAEGLSEALLQLSQEIAAAL
ncbi:PqiC family protein [Porticoccus sp. GXU_MW_L64]